VRGGGFSPIYKCNFPVALRVHSYLSPRRNSGGEERPGRYPRCGGAGAGGPRIYSSRHANVGSGCPRNIDGPWVINIFRDLNHKLNPQTNLPADSCFRAGVPSPNRAHAVTIHFHEYRASRRRILPEDETRIGVPAERKERAASTSRRAARDAGNALGITLLSGLLSSAQNEANEGSSIGHRKREGEGGKRDFAATRGEERCRKRRSGKHRSSVSKRHSS
jgi:hypothetical protein